MKTIKMWCLNTSNMNIYFECVHEHLYKVGVIIKLINDDHHILIIIP